MAERTPAGTQRVTELRPWADVARKVIAAGLAGVTATGVVWIAALVGVELPQQVAAAIATGAAFLAGYFVPGTKPTE